VSGAFRVVLGSFGGSVRVMRLFARTSLPFASFVVCVSLVSLGCGKKPEPSTAAEAKGNQLDVYSLFPAGAIGMGKLDVTALFHAGKTGEALGHLLSSYSPLGPESGFSVEANVDRLVCASYQVETADVLCVAEGRFDEKKLDQAVTDLETHAKTDPALAGKAPAVVRTPYAGRTLVTASNVGFTVLDGTHLLAGTENAMRRALDRIRDGATPKRELGAAFEERVLASKSDLAVSYSLGGLTLGRLNFGIVKVRLLQGLREVYGTGSFKKKFVDAGTTAVEKTTDPATESDVTLVAHLVYGDESKATASKDEAESLLGFGKLGASMGYTPRIARQDVTAKGNETIVVLGFQDTTLASWIEKAPEQFGLPAPAARSRGATGAVPGADSAK